MFKELVWQIPEPLPLLPATRKMSHDICGAASRGLFLVIAQTNLDVCVYVFLWFFYLRIVFF